MIQDVVHGLAVAGWNAWQVLTVPPASRPFTRFYRERYYEADLEHVAGLPPAVLRRDWQGRQE